MEDDSFGDQPQGETDPNVAFGVPDLWQDQEAARKINGIFANRLFVQPLGDGMLRINFGQVTDEEPTYHTAIVVSAQHAVAFGELIARYGHTMLVPPPPAPPPMVRMNTPSVPPPPPTDDHV